MNTRIAIVFALSFCGLTAAAWSQDVPPPPPTPDLAPLAAPPASGAPAAASAQPAPYSAPPPAAYAAPPGAYAAPPAVYAPPPGAVMVVPAQPYPYAYPAYPPRGVYGRPVFVAAPPLPSYEWSAGVDALFLERSSGGSVPLGYSLYNPNPGLPPALPTDTLYSDDVLMPLEAGVRLEVSRKFSENMTVAATYWGLQQWSVSNGILGDPNNDTVLAFSPYLQLPTLLNGLDNSLSYTYASQVENVEVNAMFRLSADNPYWRLDWLWGARYINLSDQFTLTGVDSLNSATESLAYTTSNNLVGVQTGLMFVHGWDRFQWETGLKFGLTVNMYRQHGTDTASDPSGVPAGFVPLDASNNGSDLSALFEVSLAARLRLTNALWLRLGYQFYDITGLALAPRQLGGFGHGGNVALDGLSIGLQATW